jgi:chromosome segregation ATPase
MTNSDHNAQAKFRRDAINVMTNHVELVNMRLDKTEATVARAADAIEQQTINLTTLSGNIDRLERAITQMVTANEAQRETVNSLIRMATMLIEQRAS